MTFAVPSSSSRLLLFRGFNLLIAGTKLNPIPIPLSSFSFSSRHSFCSNANLRSRFLLRSFNSSLSYQSPHDETCAQSDGQENEEQRYQNCKSEAQHVRRLQLSLKIQSTTTKQAKEIRGVPLKDVVADCARHSFKDYLKKANNDDVDAQMIVGKMYCAGYGVNKDLQKGQDWINKAQLKWKKKSVKLSKDSEDEEFFFI